ncbi:ABC-three component system middle component 4 [Desulfolutivibrio sp.]|uniref:ABC-three component system middle component 4 n=1 Tax=Desulfolutivibrio sp. TaxID=2773296 RepID=UPI002F960BEB
MLNHNLPFANLNNDFYTYALRILILLKHLDKTAKSNKPILTLRRLFLYDYLLNRPFLLRILLKKNGLGELNILAYEKTDIRTPNLQYIIENQRLEIVLNALTSAEIASIAFSNELGLVFLHTDRGGDILQLIDTKFFARLENHAQSMKPLQTKKESFLALEINKIHQEY